MSSVYHYNSAGGQTKNGVQLGPKIITDQLKAKYNIRVYDPISEREPRQKNKLNYNDVSNDCEQMYESIQSDNSDKLLFLGGDHSMAIGTIPAMIEKYSNLFVLWIDAHADINTSTTTTSNNIHGMPVAQITGLEKYEKFDWIQKYLPFTNLIYIGIRDIDSAEVEFIKNNCVKVITVENIKSNGIESVVDLLKDVTDGNPVHISLDVDGIDPQYIPSTGTVASEGLDLYDIIYLIHSFTNDIRSMDITEFNPLIGTRDDVDNSLASIMKIIDAFYCK